MAKQTTIKKRAAAPAMNAEQFSQYMAMMSNATYTLTREALARLISPQRDIDAQCQYPATIGASEYEAMWARLGLAARVVELWPEECWKAPPEVYETEDVKQDTDFEKAWKELTDRLPLWNVLYRADVLSGVGQYGVLLLGLDDGQTLDQPVLGLDEKGERTTAKETKVLYLRPFSEDSAGMESPKVIDQANPRYGHPVLYRLSYQGESGTKVEQKVHWTRIVHLADNRADSDLYGVPRLQRVYNNLLDVKKISGGSGEMFWRGGFPGYSFELSPELQKNAGNVTIDTEALKEQIYKWGEGLQRWMYLAGVTAKSLAPQVADPSGHLDWHVKLIAMALGVPYRILLGSEEAKLASTQDKRTWNERVQKRRDNYLTPMVVRPFVDRLIALGVLPEPKEYFVDWPDLDSPTEADVSEVALKQTDAMAKYVTGGVESLIPPREWFTTVLKKTPDEADAIEKARAELSDSVDNDDGKGGQEPPDEIEGLQ